MGQDVDLFGEVIVKDELLKDKFIIPPFSIFNRQSGDWQKRKNKWKSLGIKSEVGRDASCIHLDVSSENSKQDANYTSIFDPVLCEICYSWFCPKGGLILDPFAGGSVRGIIANYLGFKYVGCELRKEQVDSNNEQGQDIIPNSKPNWITGDSEETTRKLMPNVYDFIFSCPPYHDLEVYSDDPNDLSNMDYPTFLAKYTRIIKQSLDVLKNNRFAVFVVGDMRDKNGFYKNFVDETKKAFITNGAGFYNDIILMDMIGSASMRAEGNMANRKVAKIHQNVLVFFKGDTKKIQDVFADGEKK